MTASSVGTSPVDARNVVGVALQASADDCYEFVANNGGKKVTCNPEIKLLPSTNTL
jgi:hypothetical protein